MSDPISAELAALHDMQLGELDKKVQEMAAILAVIVPADIAFGPRDDDKMPRTWAERGLTWLHKERPQVFAAMMLAITATNAKVTGGK